MKKWSIIVCIFVLVFAGCQQAKAPLVIGLIKPSMNHVPVSLAKELGYLPNADIRWFNSGWELNEAMAAHAVDLAVMPFTYAWTDVAAGKDVQIVSFLERESDGVITTREITSVEQLDGCKIGVLRASTLDGFAELMALKYGIAPELVYFRTPMDMAAALQAGQVDALSYYIPSILKLDASRFHVIHWYGEDQPMHPCCDLVSHASALKTKSEAIEQAQGAIEQAVAYMQSHPVELENFLVKTFALDPTIARQSLQHIAWRTGLEDAGRRCEAELYNILLDKEYTTSEVDADDVYAAPLD
jgi:ABC-type nitrate/sulfonate/bicarbonate transport system substrate-binding protein